MKEVVKKLFYISKIEFINGKLIIRADKTYIKSVIKRAFKAFLLFALAYLNIFTLIFS